MKRILALLTVLLLALPALALGLPATPTPAPDAQSDADAACVAVDDFFYFWRIGSVETQLLLTAPSWRAAQADPQAALSSICEGWYPAAPAEILSVSGSDGDVFRTVRVKASMLSGNAASTYVFTVYVQKEDGVWYVDPQSVARRTAPAATPTPMPAPQSAPGDTPLYYNPDGGSKYHADPNCGAVAARYLPMTGVFFYSQLNEAFYADLKPCAYCAAPQPPESAAPASAQGSLILYYDPYFGTKYHIDPNCSLVDPVYRPLYGRFAYIRLNEAHYIGLEPCTVCGAPQRPAAIPVYVDGVLTEGYLRETPIDTPSGADYNAHGFMVGTAQGDSFRSNAAICSLESAPAFLELIWTASADAPEDFNISSSVQPVIIKWPREVRESMNLTPAALNTTALKEIILPGMDGRIHFFNLADGTLTRPAIDIGYPIGSAVTLHPLGFPLMLTGQYNGETATHTGHSGLRYIELTQGNVVRFVDGEAAIPAMTRQPLWGGFNTAPLIDQNTNTAVFLSDDGWLFTEELSYYPRMSGQNQITFEFGRPHSVAAQVSEHYITADPVMYGSRLWLGNEAGQVICVDTTTMQPLWTVDGLHGVSALAMREASEGTQLLAVTGLGEAHLVCLDPDTGTILADIPLALSVAGPSHASAPVIGKESLDGLVFVNLSGTSDMTAGLAEVCAVDLTIGQISWRVPGPDFISCAQNAPVAVYDDNGNGYLVSAIENDDSTTLLLLEGATGVLLDTLTLEGFNPGAPAAYGDMLVITTLTIYGESRIHGIRLTPVPAPAPHPENAEALINAFMNAWAANDRKAMLALCAPSWYAAQPNAEQTLFIYLANRTACAWAFDSTTTDDPSTLNLRVRLDAHNGREPVWRTCTITIAEEDGQLWIRPEFLAAFISADPCEPPAGDAILTPDK